MSLCKGMEEFFCRENSMPVIEQMSTKPFLWLRIWEVNPTPKRFRQTCKARLHSWRSLWRGSVVQVLMCAFPAIFIIYQVKTSMRYAVGLGCAPVACFRYWPSPSFCWLSLWFLMILILASNLSSSCLKRNSSHLLRICSHWVISLMTAMSLCAV